MSGANRQHGFALLLVLVLVMLAGVALAAVARQSVREALETRGATEALQRRWAVISCRSTLLPRVQGALAQADAVPTGEDGRPLPGTPPREPDAHRWYRCTLAGIDYDLVLTDEQAKYNPTVMRLLTDDRAMRDALRDLTPSGAGSAARREQRVALRPLVGIDASGRPIEERPGEQQRHAAYAGYGQLFADSSPRALLGTADRPGAAHRVTCWGDGRLNIERAPRRVVMAALEPVLGRDGVNELLAARDEAPGLGLSGWLKSVGSATPTQQHQARVVLTESTQCQGLWVIARGRTRVWASLSVREVVPMSRAEAEAQAVNNALLSQRGRAGDEPAEAIEPYDPVRYYDFAW